MGADVFLEDIELGETHVAHGASERLLLHRTKNHVDLLLLHLLVIPALDFDLLRSAHGPGHTTHGVDFHVLARGAFGRSRGSAGGTKWSTLQGGTTDTGGGGRRGERGGAGLGRGYRSARERHRSRCRGRRVHQSRRGETSTHGRAW
eukprot:1353708-Amorphochlora_amoeboformis.AAC.1